MSFHPTIQTVVVILAFVVLYISLLFRKATKDALDLYDLFLLSIVAVLPGLFVLFPSQAEELARLMGVGYAFLVLFGLLFFAAFVYLHRLAVKANRLEAHLTTVIQELAILNMKELGQARQTSPVASPAGKRTSTQH